jgi:hypothetical protein
MDAPRREAVIATLTPPRLTKYLVATNNDPHRALRLYALNTRVSAEFLADLHYVEIALRNRFDEQLTLAFGASWSTTLGFEHCCRSVLWTSFRLPAPRLQSTFLRARSSSPAR